MSSIGTIFVFVFLMGTFNLEYDENSKLWICVHPDTGVYCQFKQYYFRRTYEFNIFEYNTSPIDELCDIIDSMITWLHENHSDKL